MNSQQCFVCCWLLFGLLVHAGLIGCLPKFNTMVQINTIIYIFIWQYWWCVWKIQVQYKYLSSFYHECLDKRAKRLVWNSLFYLHIFIVMYKLFETYIWQLWICSSDAISAQYCCGGSQSMGNTWHYYQQQYSNLV